jgi:transcription elongation factor GreB
LSRAFVKEQDGPELAARPEPALPPGVPNRITSAGAARFRARLQAARDERRALGDGGLDSARRAELDADIRWLERRIGTFSETPVPAAPTRAGFGTTVTMVRGDRSRTVTIAGVDEVDADRGWVSFTSPVAQALLGAEPGDLVTVRAPGGEEEWEVEAVAGAREP